jgi:pimeloyl-ACP methyl ester carboxylesterase
MNEIRAFAHYKFDAGKYRSLKMPVLLLTGSESPRELYGTDALNEVLPDARIVVLQGTAHEGMTMVPDQFVEKVTQFLLTAESS